MTPDTVAIRRAVSAWQTTHEAARGAGEEWPSPVLTEAINAHGYLFARSPRWLIELCDEVDRLRGVS